MSNEVEQTQNVSPSQMIREAITGRANLDQLEKLLALQERWEANEAKKVFASSFALVQANIATVVKTKDNQQTHSKYADLGNIIESAKPIYTKEGFSVIFYEGETTIPENIRICADVLHLAGHKETYHYDIPLDGVGIKGNVNMTKIHGKASSTSYGRRYLMCMIWNIPTGDDTDGVTEDSVISMDQIIKIKNLISDSGADMGKTLKYMQVAKIEDILQSNYQKAITALESYKEKKK